MLEQISEIAETTTPPADTIPKMLYDGARPKQKSHCCTHTSTKSKIRNHAENTTISGTIQMLVTHELPPKSSEKKEVI